MKIATCRLRSASPYSQSKFLVERKGREESYEEFESRVWWQRFHWSDSGCLIIPPMAFKITLSEAAKFTPRKGPGGGKSTWTKNFEAGVLCLDPVELPHKKEDLRQEALQVPSDGRKGGSTRVLKIFGVVDKWEAEVKFYVVDESITDEIFETYLVEAGKFVGIGRWRVRNGGLYGRFAVDEVAWSKE